MNFRQSFKYLALIALILGLFSCEGIFNGIYDDAVPAMSAEMGDDKVTVDASDYEQWAYINFHTMEVENVKITLDEEGQPNFTEPEEWDIAIHRFQAKTNGGAAIETSYSTIDEFLASGTLPTGEYSEDEWSDQTIIVDLSGMMSGNIKYCPSYVNNVLTSWISSSGMPPVYTTSDKVYVVRLKDNTFLALRLESYMDNSGTKGYMTYSYAYPINFEK